MNRSIGSLHQSNSSSLLAPQEGEKKRREKSRLDEMDTCQAKRSRARVLFQRRNIAIEQVAMRGLSLRTVKMSGPLPSLSSLFLLIFSSHYSRIGSIRISARTQIYRKNVDFSNLGKSAVLCKRMPRVLN